MFALSEDSRVELRRITRGSALDDPVLTLADEGPEISVPQEAAREYLSHGDISRLREFAEQYTAEHMVEQGVKWTLMIGAHDRRDCNREDLVDVDGFTFAISPAMRAALRAYRLEFRAGLFFLESADDCAGSLRTVKTLAPWFEALWKA